MTFAVVSYNLCYGASNPSTRVPREGQDPSFMDLPTPNLLGIFTKLIITTDPNQISYDHTITYHQFVCVRVRVGTNWQGASILL